MPAGGALTIEAGVTEMDEQFIKAYGYGTQGTYVLLTVSDSGSGMDEKTRSQIFEKNRFLLPKRWVKEQASGFQPCTALSSSTRALLTATVSRAREQPLKYICPWSKQQALLCSRLQLPVRRCSQAAAKRYCWRKIDDDLRKLIEQVLEDFGYTVRAAADGDGAVGVFMAHHDDINLLLLDVIMPKKNGREAYAEMQKIEPAVKALFTSGYTADIIHKQELLDKGFEFILKPVSPTELLKKVRDVLDK